MHIRKDILSLTLRGCHNGHDSNSNHKPHDCLLNRLFRRRSKKTSKLRVTGLVPGEFPAQMACNAENVSIWWRHHDKQTDIHLHSDASEYIHIASNYVIHRSVLPIQLTRCRTPTAVWCGKATKSSHACWNTNDGFIEALTKHNRSTV